MKIVYLMHAIGGDVQKNVHDLLDIIRDINLHEPNVVPFAPYVPDVLALDDSNIQHRARGIQNDTEIIKRGFIDEAWAVGETLSEGMKAEIELFNKLGIPVIIKVPSKKTSNEWVIEGNYIILDYDGWDRFDFEYSFYEEKITEMEFLKRLSRSTIKMKGGK